MISIEDLKNDFNIHIKRNKDIQSNLVSRKRILHFLEKRKEVTIYEWDYSLKKWLRNVDHFHDMNVTEDQLEHFGKKFARYEIFHPEFGLLKAYKHVAMFKNDSAVVYVMSVPSGEEFPKGLV